MCVLIVVALSHALGAEWPMPTSQVLGRSVNAIGDALLAGVFASACSLGLDLASRRSPRDPSAWDEFWSGSWAEPEVGRKVLIGCAVGVMLVLTLGVLTAVRPLWGLGGPPGQGIDLRTLAGHGSAARVLLEDLARALTFAPLLALIGPALGRRVGGEAVSRLIHVLVLAGLLCWGGLHMLTSTPNAVLVAAVGLVSLVLATGLVRLGALAFAAAWFSAALLMHFPVAHGVAQWMVPASLMAVVSVLGLATLGLACWVGVWWRGTTTRA